MPDEAKHAALAANEFKLARTCRTCVHWSAREYRAPTVWGTCARAPYQHGKHTGERDAGTPAIGTCARHSLNMDQAELLAGLDYASRYAGES